MSPLSEIFRSPDLFPIRFEFKRNTAVFTKVGLGEYRALSFLGPCAPREAATCYRVAIDYLFTQASEGRNPSPRAMHYILHPAFSCSTLLARDLQCISGCLLLKEPYVLTQLAWLGEPMGPSPCRKGRLLDLCLDLFERRYSSDSVVIVKPSDKCNHLAEALLSRNTESRILIIATTLERFLIHALKSAERRQWLRSALRHFAVLGRSLRLVADTDCSDLPDARGAALIWLVQRSLANRLTELHPQRVMTVLGEEVAGNASAMLLRIVEWLGLSADGPLIERILTRPERGQHAKMPSVSYNVWIAAEQDSRYFEVLREEIADGVRWADSVCAACGDSRVINLGDS